MASTIPRISVSALESMPEDGNRYEVIDGELFVSTAPGFLHQNVLTNILIAFAWYLRQNPIGKILPGIGVVFDEYNGVIPDLVFMTHETRRMKIAGGRMIAAPDIAIEILSPGSWNQRRDRDVKLGLYSARGVREYWIVDPDNRAVDMYVRSGEALEFRGSLRGGDAVTSELLPGFRAAVEDLFAE